MAIKHKTLLAAGSAALLFAADAWAGDLSAPQRDEIGAIVREYLIKHPEVIKEALEELERRQVAETQAKSKQTIADRGDEIYRSSGDLVLGNPAGKFTVVEFFDYNCGYCKRAVPEVAKLIQSDKDVRVVIKEFPILGPGSVFAAKAAIASAKQGKYLEFHNALTALEAMKDENSVIQVAEEVGLDTEKLKRDMEDAAVTELIQRNYGLAEALSINGTPSFVIDDAIEPGFVPFEVLSKHVTALRQNGGCKVC